jgi:DNA-binding IclR family transcriptional regulator
MAEQGRSDRRVKATGTALDLLEAIAEAGGAGVTELARQTGYSKGTVHHHLATLQDRDYLVKEGDVYHVGLPFLTLGGLARRRTKLYHVAKSEVDRLADQTGELAQLTVEENRTGYYVYQAPGDGDEPGATHLGSSLDLHSTASGKALLSGIPRSAATAVLEERATPARTDRTKTDTADLLAELEQISSDGVAFDDREHMPNLRCVAAPIDVDGIRGAISVSGAVEVIDDERFREDLPEYVRNAATVIEINAQYSAWLGDQS